MKTYRGYEFKRAVVTLIHKVCSDLSLRPVEVQWDGGTQTACINQSGSVRLANVKDDAVLTQGDIDGGGFGGRFKCVLHQFFDEVLVCHIRIFGCE